MKTRIIIGTSTYCVITDDGYSFDQRIEPGMTVVFSLLLSANEYRDKAERMLKCADRCEQAAELIALEKAQA